MPYVDWAQLSLEPQLRTLSITYIHILALLYNLLAILRMHTVLINTAIQETQWLTTRKQDKRSGISALEKLTTFS